MLRVEFRWHVPKVFFDTCRYNPSRQMKSAEERWRLGECTPVNTILLQAAASPSGSQPLSCRLCVGSANANLPSGHCALPSEFVSQIGSGMPTDYQDMQAGQWTWGWNSHLSPKVSVCHFRSGRLKFKQLSMKEIIETRVRRVQKPSHSSVPTAGFEPRTKVGCLAVVTAKVSLNCMH